jgi:hypothetical protein
MSMGRGKQTATQYITFYKRYLYYLTPHFAQPTYCYCFVKIEKRRKRYEINKMENYSHNKSCIFLKRNIATQNFWVLG